jgi:4-hydroxy-tetrahydrodipicolinate synthase
MFKGVFTALVTPFEQDGSIDERWLRELVEAQIKGGVAGLVPVGTTGESPTVDHRENIEIIRIVIEQANGRVPVIAGTGSNSTQEAIEMTARAKELGADASLQVAPYYNKPSQEGFYRHFTAIADAVDLPMIVYNIPGRTGKNIENETMLRLAGHPNIVGVKEASGSFTQVMELIERKPASFSLLSGDDNLLLPIAALGGDGVISVASNLVPEMMVELTNECLAGNMANARALHYRLLPLFRVLFIETNPIPIKYALSLKGMLKEVYRLPLCPLSDPQKRQVERVVRDLALL